MCWLIAKPTPRRENRPRIAARYSQPSAVQTYVMSVTQATSGASTPNFRSKMFSATGSACFECVVALKRRFRQLCESLRSTRKVSRLWPGEQMALASATLPGRTLMQPPDSPGHAARGMGRATHREDAEEVSRARTANSAIRGIAGGAVVHAFHFGWALANSTSPRLPAGRTARFGTAANHVTRVSPCVGGVPTIALDSLLRLVARAWWVGPSPGMYYAQ